MREESLLQISGFLQTTNDVDGKLTEYDIKNMGRQLWEDLISDISYRLEIGDNILNYNDMEDEKFDTEKFDDFIYDTIHSLIETNKIHINTVDFSYYNGGEDSGYDYIATVDVDIYDLLDQFRTSSRK